MGEFEPKYGNHPHRICDLCGNHHHFTDDGFQYLDCYWYFRSRDTKLGKRKEPMVEILKRRSGLRRINPLCNSV